jgi:Predicted N6-adenine-specific DNA methylase
LRGYKKHIHQAHINKVLAATLLLQSGWHGQYDFLDSMCGSGTLLIEAAMIATRIPAGCYRKSFAFLKLKNVNQNLFDTVKKRV